MIKVLSVVATDAEYDDLYYEAAVAKSMSTFQVSDLAHPGYRHCAIIKRSFTQDSTHGEHLCVVFTPYGASLRNILQTSPTCHLPLRRPVNFSLCTSYPLTCIADVKLANILVELDTSTEEIDRFLANNPPQIYADSPPIDPRVSPHPIPAVRSQPLPNFGLDPSYENLHVRLIDYGSGMCYIPSATNCDLTTGGLAIRVDDIRPDTFICTPTELRAPEMILGHAWSYPVEVWAVGCLVRAESSASCDVPSRYCTS